MSAAQGDLDTTFNAPHGYALYNESENANWDEQINAVVLQPDGKLVVAGMANWDNSQNAGPVVMRYTRDGRPDSSFGDGGKVIFGDDNGWAAAVALQPDGKIVAAGFASGGTSWDIALLRYNADGTLDSAFGDAGVVTYFAGRRNFHMALALDGNGKIVVAGHVRDNDILLLRYNSDGTPDTAFGVDGLVTYDGGHNDYGYALDIHRSGAIFAAGTSSADIIVLKLIGQRPAMAAPLLELLF